MYLVILLIFFLFLIEHNGHCHDLQSGSRSPHIRLHYLYQEDLQSL